MITKQLLYLLPLLLCASCKTESFAHRQLNNVEVFCKTWGLLKYYSPYISINDLNWDSVFTSEIDYYIVSNDSRESETRLINFIKLYNKPSSDIETVDSYPNDSTYNFKERIAWISQLPPRVSDLLKTIIGHFKPYNNIFIEKKNNSNIFLFKESQQHNKALPNKQERLLALARYWNIINYYYPYRHVVYKNWDSILTHYCKVIQSSETDTSYQLNIQMLCNEINDSHSWTDSPFLRQYWGEGILPFNLMCVDSCLIVVSRSPNPSQYDSVMKRLDIHPGSTVISIDHQVLHNYRDTMMKYVPGSNNSAKQHNLNIIQSRGRTGQFVITYEFLGQRRTISAERIPLYEFTKKKPRSSEPYMILDDSIGYINLVSLDNPTELNQLLSKCTTLTSLIFDLRGYPKFFLIPSLENTILPQDTFCIMTMPKERLPGEFYSEPRILLNHKNNSYEGNVVILVNEKTQSTSEFTAMALQLATHATVLGSQTSGADGDVCVINLPGNISTYFSGSRITYPDGRETQRIGIVPDILVKPTIQGIRSGVDEVLEAALDYIKHQKRPKKR